MRCLSKMFILMSGHLMFVNIEHSWTADVFHAPAQTTISAFHQDFCGEPVPAAGIIDHRGTSGF